MIKRNLKVLIISSIVTLLPIVAGLILWNQLPEQMPTHWNATGEIDGWSSKPFAVFGLPLIILAAQWLCVVGTSADPKKQNHSDKVLHLVFWIIPIISVVMGAVTYATALGIGIRIEVVTPILVGLVLAIVGNYLPKCKQNYTVGIKIPWTLNSEENWNRTHRFAGWLWTFCGIAIILIGIVGSSWIFPIVALLMIFAPILYSYLLFRKGI